MASLRAAFEGMGFEHVETFIASGNVLIDAPARGHAAIERRIARGLRDALGYDVDVFLRSGGELAVAADRQPFAAARLASAAALNVGFIHEALDTAQRRRLASLETDIDGLAVAGREIYWLCQRRQSESALSNAVFETTLGVRCTLRNINTVRTLADKVRP